MWISSEGTSSGIANERRPGIESAAHCVALSHTRSVLRVSSTDLVWLGTTVASIATTGCSTAPAATGRVTTTRTPDATAN